ncbi:MAG TPA: S46 family peptidase, partial [Gammaproteobacteria bacterium]|nr:S46 family peptidase [Gammaproteobacteria bacterium]
MKTLLLIVAASLFAVSAAQAGEGMWTLDNLPVKTLQQKFQFTPSDEWVNHVQLASVRLAGGCSGSFVSPHGLVLTNHHCAVECLEALSTSKRDLMASSFYARNRDDELKCPAMEVERLEKTTNVTDTMTQAMEGKTGAARNAAEKAESSKLEQGCVAGQADKWRCQIVSLYHGGQYWLYKYRRFQDVRLVFAPSQSTAFFGGNPDNFNFPRYDYDVTLLRVYVDHKPANTPTYFKMSPKGPQQGELVFTSGNPGSTERNYTIAQLDALRYPGLPNALKFLAQYRGLVQAFSAQSDEHERIARGTLFFLGNAMKSLRHQLAALENEGLFQRKVRQERELRHKVESNPDLAKKYGDAWEKIAAAEQQFLQMREPYMFIVRGEGFLGRLYDIAFNLVLGAHERSLPDAKRITEFRQANLPGLEQQLFSKAPVYPDFDKLRLTFSMVRMRDLMGYDAPIVKALFGKMSPEQLAAQATEGTKLADVDVRKRLWKGGEEAIKASDDPMIELARQVLPFWLKYHERYENEIKATMMANTAKVARARFAIYGTSIAPDATFTERVSYGAVKGWPRGGVQVPAFTYVKGLYERATGYPPLKLSQKWLDAK